MKTVDFKIKNKSKFEYYSVYHEHDEYVFSENLKNMGVIYSIVDRFKSEDELKACMLQMEAKYQDVFERV
jgi:hypothetical protein